MAAGAPDPVLVVRGPIGRAHLPGLCDRVCALLCHVPGRSLICDVAAVEPDAVAVDALARLQVAARRHGCRVWLRGASDELVELVAFMGLADVLPERPMSSGARGRLDLE